MSTVYLMLSFFFVQNLLLVFGLGMTPAFREGMAFRWRTGSFLATALLMLVSAMAAWGLHALIVGYLGLQYLRTLVFVLVLVCLIYGTRGIAWRFSQTGTGNVDSIIMPVNTSSATLGLMILVSGQGLGAVEALAAACGGILGYGVALFLYSEVLRRMDLEWVPKPFRGLPLALISLGLIALIFMSVSALLLPGLR